MSDLGAGTELLGKYRITEEIGRGGMAVVYRARDLAHRRDVAVKVLLHQPAVGKSGARFALEIDTAARLSHPHILALYDSGEWEGHPFFVTGLVEGRSLREVIKHSGRLSVEDGLRISSQMAGALGHAHRLGVVHRDVKPGNILIDVDGNAYLADFGISKATLSEGPSEQLTTGYAPGTLRYMSPEQLAGEAVGPPSDVYSLGCVLFEMLIGSPPYADMGALGIAAAHLASPPPSVRERRADVPESVEALVHTCMGKRPDRRYPTGAAAKMAIDSAWRNVSSPSVPLKEGRRPERRIRAAPIRRGRMFIALGSIAVIVGVALRSAGEWRRPSAPLLQNRLAIVPLLAPGMPERQIRAIVTELGDAVAQWEDLDVMVQDPLLMEEASSGESAVRAAAVGAERYFRVAPTFFGDSVRVEITAQRTTTPADAPIREVVYVRFDGNSRPDWLRTAERLLFGGEQALPDSVYPFPRQAAAQAPLARGRHALAAWDLQAAESDFSAALAFEPDLPWARLWRAQVRNWLDRPATDWGDEASLAMRGRASLPSRERALGAALVSMAADAHPDACTLYRSLGSTETPDVAAVLGLGYCQVRDPVVIPDPEARFGWTFRGSSHGGTEAIKRAMLALPSTSYSLSSSASGLLGLIPAVRLSELRGGRSSGDGSPFVGVFAWHADTLAVIAVPLARFGTFQAEAGEEEHARLYQRAALLEIGAAWVRGFPDSPGAHFALAQAQELVGDEGAVASYRMARAAHGALDSWGLLCASAEATLAIRTGLPDDVRALRAAVALADSVLQASPAQVPREAAAAVATLAALLQRPQAAREWARYSAADPTDPLERASAELLALAAAGASATDLHEHFLRVSTLVTRVIPPERQADVLASRVEQAALLAYPRYRAAYFSTPTSRFSPEAMAIASLATNESIGDEPEVAGAEARIGWDIFLTRVRIRAEADNDTGRLVELSGRLASLAFEDPEQATGVARAGALGQAVRAYGEWSATTAAGADSRWVDAATILFAGADSSR